MRSQARIALACAGILCLAGCESDYVLGVSTPTELGSGTPTASLTPPEFSPTPSPGEGTDDPGSWVASVRVEPADLELGSLWLGCDGVGTVSLINDGTVPVDLVNLRFVGSAEVIRFQAQTDIQTLLPGESGVVVITGEPEALGEGVGALQINVTEVAAPSATVSLSATVFDPVLELTDTYYQQPQTAVDVLWVIDNSGSMGDDQENLAENLDEFLSIFLPLGVKYHMGIVTTDTFNPADTGKLEGIYNDKGQHFVDWTMREDGEEAFRRTLLNLGSGSSTERGLEAMELALTPPLTNTWNDGFLRDDAFLSVIFISDEEDQSRGYEAKPNTYWQDYFDLLVSLKGDGLGFVCSSIFNYLEPGGYQYMAEACGGVLAPIQNDYADVLIDLGLVSAGLNDDFPLTAHPIEGGTITVTVDGEQVDYWSLNPETNAIEFPEGLEPPPDSRIDIRYTGIATCDDPVPDDAQLPPSEEGRVGRSSARVGGGQ